MLAGGNPYGHGFVESVPPGAPFAYGPLALLWYLPSLDDPGPWNRWPRSLVLVAAGPARPGPSAWPSTPSRRPSWWRPPTAPTTPRPACSSSSRCWPPCAGPSAGAVLLALATAFKPYALAWLPGLIGYGGLGPLLAFVAATVAAWLAARCWPGARTRCSGPSVGPTRSTPSPYYSLAYALGGHVPLPQAGLAGPARRGRRPARRARASCWCGAWPSLVIVGVARLRGHPLPGLVEHLRLPRRRRARSSAGTSTTGSAWAASASPGRAIRCAAVGDAWIDRAGRCVRPGRIRHGAVTTDWLDSASPSRRSSAPWRCRRGGAHVCRRNRSAHPGPAADYLTFVVMVARHGIDGGGQPHRRLPRPGARPPPAHAGQDVRRAARGLDVPRRGTDPSHGSRRACSRSASSWAGSAPSRTWPRSDRHEPIDVVRSRPRRASRPARRRRGRDAVARTQSRTAHERRVEGQAPARGSPPTAKARTSSDLRGDRHGSRRRWRPRRRRPRQRPRAASRCPRCAVGSTTRPVSSQRLAHGSLDDRLVGLEEAARLGPGAVARRDGAPDEDELVRVGHRQRGHDQARVHVGRCSPQPEQRWRARSSPVTGPIDERALRSGSSCAASGPSQPGAPSAKPRTGEPRAGVVQAAHGPHASRTASMMVPMTTRLPARTTAQTRRKRARPASTGARPPPSATRARAHRRSTTRSTMPPDEHGELDEQRGHGRAQLEGHDGDDAADERHDREVDEAALQRRGLQLGHALRDERSAVGVEGHGAGPDGRASGVPSKSLVGTPMSAAELSAAGYCPWARVKPSSSPYRRSFWTCIQGTRVAMRSRSRSSAASSTLPPSSTATNRQRHQPTLSGRAAVAGKTFVPREETSCEPEGRGRRGPRGLRRALGRILVRLRCRRPRRRQRVADGGSPTRVIPARPGRRWRGRRHARPCSRSARGRPPEVPDDGIREAGGGRGPLHVARLAGHVERHGLAFLERHEDGILDALCRVRLAEMAQHHDRAEDERRGVDDVLAGVLRRRAVDGLEDGHLVAVVAGGREAEAARRAPRPGR